MVWQGKKIISRTSETPVSFFLKKLKKEGKTQLVCDKFVSGKDRSVNNFYKWKETLII